MGVKGNPAEPSNGEDDNVIESYDNPHLLLDAEVRNMLDDEDLDPTDTPACLMPGRKLPSLRITQQDLIKYNYSDDCPRCIATQFGDLSANPSHLDSCRRRIFKAMFQADDPKLSRWLRDHPTDQANVGPSIQDAPSPSSSSTAPAPSSAPMTNPPEAPLPPPGQLHVFEDLDENEFSQVVTLLVSHGVDEVDAQRFVCSAVKGQSQNEPTGFFELYGRGGLSKAAKRYRGLNVEGLQVLDLRTSRPDGEAWDFTRKHDRHWALRLLREQQPTWVIAAPPCTAFSSLNHA